jgi:hypothetical protein
LHNSNQIFLFIAIDYKISIALNTSNPILIGFMAAIPAVLNEINAPVPAYF